MHWKDFSENIIRIFCFSIEKEWCEGTHLFAVKESVQESLGLGPFELDLNLQDYVITF